MRGSCCHPSLLCLKPTFYLFYFLLSPMLTASSLVNRTIDDQYGDIEEGIFPQYSPPELWAQGATCDHCSITPGILNVSQVFNGTWHDTTYECGQADRVVNVAFTGVAVYVYGIVPNSIPNVTTFANISFFLDNELVHQYVHDPNTSSVIEYNTPVYVETSLPNMEHSLEIRFNGLNDSLFLFDYVVYTTTSDLPPQ
ncbi:hypothetical protein BD311DRAFT_707228, partial [Dichomitus squalens]